MRVVRNLSLFVLALVCWLSIGQARLDAYYECYWLGDNRMLYMYTEEGDMTEAEAEEFCEDVEEDSFLCRAACLDMCEGYDTNEPGSCQPFQSDPLWDVEIDCACSWGYGG
jgi:hypothetical protein